MNCEIAEHSNLVKTFPLTQVLRHSRLYESAAAYVTDQPPFLNAALAVRTTLSPPDLLTALKQIEVRFLSRPRPLIRAWSTITLLLPSPPPHITPISHSQELQDISAVLAAGELHGIAAQPCNRAAAFHFWQILCLSLHEDMSRQQVASLQASAGRDFESRRWGPRPLDLDIIFYGSASLASECLQVPHARWQERDFVKAPLADLYSADELGPLRDPVAANLRMAQALWEDAGGEMLFVQQGPGVQNCNPSVPWGGGGGTFVQPNIFVCCCHHLVKLSLQGILNHLNRNQFSRRSLHRCIVCLR